MGPGKCGVSMYQTQKTGASELNIDAVSKRTDCEQEANEVCLRMLPIPVAMGIAKVQAFNWCICNVVIRHIIANIISAIVTEIQRVQSGMKLHPDHISDACSSSSRKSAF